MKSKRIMKMLALVIAFSMIFTTVVFAAPKHNKNDKKVKDYDNALKSLIQKEIVKGYGNGNYGLSGNVKRGDVIVMIVRMLDKYGVIDQDDYNVEKLSKNYLEIFDDVDSKDYYYGHISIAKKLGIAKGDGKYFKPNKPVTIQETIWLIERTGDLLDIKFNSDKMDELEEIYAGDLKDFAKRRDVFWMLYLILSDLDIDQDDYDYDIDEIKHTMDDDEIYKFTDKMFKDELSKVEYIEFDLPDEDEGTLYYNYKETSRRNTLVLEENKYYIKDRSLSDDKLLVSNISFVPNNDFDGEIEIEYEAYADKKSYTGLISITVDVERELIDILHTMDDDAVFKLTDNLFLRAFDFEDEDLEYINFTTLPTKGELFYNYDKSSEEEVTLRDDFYIYNRSLESSKLRISNLTYVPEDNFEGKVEIKYDAYDIDDKYYEGLLVITVERNDDLTDIKYSVKENTNLQFNYRNFYSSIDEVVFTLLDTKVGTLYFDDNNDGKLEDDEKIVKNEELTRSDLRYVYFVPYQDYKGEVTINYVAYDGNEEFDGKVIVTVQSVQEITTLSLVKRLSDESVVIDFEDNLYKSLGKELYNKTDYAKFTLPSKGQLMIKYDGIDYKAVGKDTEYVIGEIEAIKYVFDGRGTVNINYTVFDEDTTIKDKAYDGLIKIEVTR